MEGKVVVRTQAGIGDLVEILAKALLSGIGVAVAMSLAILALCAAAQAATLDESKTEPWSVAPTPPHYAQAAGVGALWARTDMANLMDAAAREADPAELRPAVMIVTVPQDSGDGMRHSQSDTASTLNLLLGLIALMSIGMVAVVGRLAGSRE
ncbi:MAG: hypothetical protein ACXWHZ_16140 [Usitatibacter sp.]